MIVHIDSRADHWVVGDIKKAWVVPSDDPECPWALELSPLGLRSLSREDRVRVFSDSGTLICCLVDGKVKDDSARFVFRGGEGDRHTACIWTLDGAFWRSDCGASTREVTPAAEDGSPGFCYNCGRGLRFAKQF